MKPVTLRCRVCAIWLMVFNWALMVSISDRFRRTLPQEQFVPEAHHAILHVLADFRQACEPLRPERVMPRLSNIAAIAKELAEEPWHEARDGLPVIDMAGHQPKRPAFSFVVHDERQCETIQPAPGGLPPRRDVRKDPVRRKTVIVTHGQSRRVDEGKAHAVAFARVEITPEGDERAGPQCDKAGVAVQARQRGAQMRHNVLGVRMLKRAVGAAMKIDQDGQTLPERQCRGTGPLALPG